MDNVYIAILRDGTGEIFDTLEMFSHAADIATRAASYLRHSRYYAREHEMEVIDFPCCCEVWERKSETSMTFYAKVYAT